MVDCFEFTFLPQPPELLIQTYFQMDIDAIFREIGELGLCQQCIYGACLCLMNMYAAFHMLQVVIACLTVLYLYLSFCVFLSIPL